VGYLAYILNSNVGEPKLSNIPIVKEFPDMFLEELLGLPSNRGVKLSINTFLEVPLIAQLLYRVALAELNELKTQLQ